MRRQAARGAVRAFAFCGAFACGPWMNTAHAELPSAVSPLDTRADGVYGRMAGDVTLSAQVNLELSPGGPAPGMRVAAHYFWMAGVYGGFSRPFESPANDRVLTFGVEARPAFIPRWALGKQVGPSTLDLMVDSVSLSLGGYFAKPHEGPFGRARGLETGLGFGVPLLGRAMGPWLETRGFLRHPDPLGGLDDAPHWAAQIGLAWHLPWLSPLTPPNRR